MIAADIRNHPSMEQFNQVLRGLWSKRWIGLAAAWAVLVVCGLAVALMKDQYQASARVYVNTQTVLKPLMQGLAQQPDLNQQVEMLARTLVSRPNAEKLLADPSLGLLQKDDGEPLTEAERAAAVTGLMRKIKITPSSTGAPTGNGNENSGTHLYAISYQDSDPQRAERLVERLLALFSASITDTKTRDSKEASRFIDEQIASHERKLTEAENRLKEFKVRNFGTSGASSGDHFSRMALLSEEISRLQVELGAAEQSRNALRRELAAVEPQVTADSLRSANASPRLNEIESRIDAERRQLNELLSRFTDQHPDVAHLRRSIASLEAERTRYVRQAMTDRSRGGAAAADPVFQRVRTALADAEANVASLRTRLGAQQARLQQAQTLGARMPEIEAELASLNRDYDVLKRNHEELVRRRESAQLGLKLDETSHMADFRVVEPPRAEPTPVAPTRKTFALFSVVLALVVGLLAAWGVAWLRPAFTSERRLRELTGRPVLGRISMVMSPDMQVQTRRDHRQFAGALGLFFVGGAALLGWLAIQARL